MFHRKHSLESKLVLLAYYITSYLTPLIRAMLTALKTFWLVLLYCYIIVNIVSSIFGRSISDITESSVKHAHDSHSGNLYDMPLSLQGLSHTVVWCHLLER